MKLEKTRREIDRLDAQIVSLLNQRAMLAVEISHQKRRSNLPVFAPDRESKLLRRLKKLGGEGPLSQQALQSIYREIISASIALQELQTIAFFGPEATFTHQAAQEQFGSSAIYLPVRGIADVFREVERGRADYGVVPIENSTEGVVNHTLDNFTESEVKICAEISLRVSQNLLSRESRLPAVKKIYTHPQPWGQCRLWLDGNLPDAEICEVSSTAKAAQLAARQKGTAALASRLAAKLHGLHILARDIQDNRNNRTRFLILGRHMPGPTGNDKTSLMLAIKDSVGALHRILKPFARYGVNLTSIESRPSRQGVWNYIFFIDCLGHIDEPKLKKAMAALKPLTSSLKVLGSYPRGE
ncbi:prephenate dehydratase [candidate division FCPU426 bacterium]|nr:prephenate dehydratase [candidate division FCPU426 bacterium]